MPSSRSLIFIVFLTAFINFLGISIIFPVVGPLLLKSGIFFPPEAEKEAIYWVGVLKSAYPLAMVIGSPLMGVMADTWGRKKVLSISLTGSMLGYGLFLMGIGVGRVWLLLVGRLIDGFSGANTAMLYATIADTIEPRERGRYFGVITAAFGAGFVLGPFLGGILSDASMGPWFGYATPFYVTILMLLVNVLFVLLYYPETFRTQDRLSLRERFQWGWVRRRGLGIEWLLGGAFLAWLGFSAYTQFVDVVMIRKFGMTSRELGIFFGYVGLWIVFTQGVLNHWASRRFHSHRLLMITLPGLVFSFIVFALAPTEGWAYATVPLISIHHGISYPHYLSTVSAQVPAGFQGRLLGLYQSVQSLAIGVAPLLISPVAAGWVSGPLWAAAVISLGAFGIYAWWGYRYNAR